MSPWAVARAANTARRPGTMMSRDLWVIVSAPGPTSAVAFASGPQRHAIVTTLEELSIEGGRNITAAVAQSTWFYDVCTG